MIAMNYGVIVGIALLVLASVLGYALAKRGLSWKALLAASLILAVCLTVPPQIPSIIDVLGGDDPVALVSIWLFVPPIVFLTLVGFGLGVAVSRPPAPTTRNVLIGVAAGLIPAMLLAFLVIGAIFSMTGVVTY